MNANGHKLIAALRAPLPEDFKWNYGRHETCAISLARTLGFNMPRLTSAELAHIIDIPDDDASKAFLYLDVILNKMTPACVTPADVADALQAIADRTGA